MNAQQHQELLKEFSSKGGSQKLVKSLEKFSLQNYAKLKYEYGKLSPKSTNDKAKTQAPDQVEAKEPAKKYTPGKDPRVFHDLIADYPVQLHATFRKRWQVWMEACSWKMQLNEVPDHDAESAFDVQLKIYECFKIFDECQKILKHYQEHKRIMPTEVSVDFSKMSELEIFKYQNKLRASITRRRQTIESLEKNLPNKENNNYAIRLHSLNRKKEQLQEKINELLECEKILKNE
ncbi:hypothetical protein [Riemerella anatipestifer]|uniref:hypothetical protein n=1 Tax=Riemerella anatipestifer TaxID=34085 RepID=UPI001BDADDEB|nr:hypothetical protein [Riemerella anatipestifer]MBT0551968.1 hypothetical protein [Riemerella anatipestifer]MBT0554154.1 hypothetical protein [Riemerella anatipestifer]MCE3024755.1 hypothetical protein [Riemerella anatipestifer]MCU7560368.1 hypothetical protein [Riemerella anatipestifer]MDY3449639.1 hypothetical protein [Riemerella anatipestifer]